MKHFNVISLNRIETKDLKINNSTCENRLENETKRCGKLKKIEENEDGVLRKFYKFDEQFATTRERERNVDLTSSKKSKSNKRTSFCR